jgi:predicted DNA-binding transcriptional regulator AlpA
VESNNDESWCGTRQVCTRYGGERPLCARTIDRWIIDPKLEFPKPTMINGRRYWRLRELRDWERQRAAVVS